MKFPLFSRTLALSGLTLLPLAWLVTGCGGGGGGGRSTVPTDPTATPIATSSATATPGSTPGATATNTPIPTPTIPSGGQRILTNINLGNGQTAVFNLVVTRLGIGVLNGLIIVPPIPAESVGTFLIAPGTYRITGLYSLPNNFRLAGNLQTVNGVNLPLTLVGKTASGSTPGTITVTAGNTTFPAQTF